MLRWLAAILILPLAPPAQEPASEVTGVVRFTGSHKPQRLNDQIRKDKHGGPHLDGRDIFTEDVVVGSKGEFANVLVRVKGPVKGDFPAPKDPVVLDAKDYLFRPRVLVLRPGQTFVMKNSSFDRFNFDVRTRRSSTMNVGITRGGSREMQFTEAEIGIEVKHLCCPWQVAWVHVMEHLFYAVTGADGTFRIKGLPAGKYELEAWHEKFGVRTATVTLDGKGALAQDFVFEGK